MMALEHN
ncbi:hypothetical protein CISIN_1g0150171mg, partial [Citrus sinensis]